MEKIKKQKSERNKISGIAKGISKINLAGKQRLFF